MTILEPPPLATEAALALAKLADCVCNELADHGAGPPCWCGLYPGAAISWDYCGECDGDRCGMGWVRLGSIFPYGSQFPVAEIDVRCQMPLAWEVEIGALRCVPQPADGELPDPVTLGEVAVAQVLDAGALYLALKCCEQFRPGVELWQPLGPEGGCVGGFWRAYLPLGVV